MTDVRRVPRLVVCRGGLAATPLTGNELDGVHGATRFYDAGDLIPRLLATVEALQRQVSEDGRRG